MRRWLLVAACLALAVMPASARAADTTQFGFFDTTYAFQRPTRFWTDYHALGAQGLRVAVNWDVIAHRQPKHPTDPSDRAYDWTTLDALVRRAQSEGALDGFLGTIWTTPGWARDKRQAPFAADPNSNLVMPRLDAFQDFLTALVTRYSGTYTPARATTPLPRIPSYQIWNEVNYYLFPFKIHGRFVVARNYSWMLKAAYETIKEYDPTLTVVTSGIDPPAYRAQPPLSPYRFIAELARRGAPFDVLAMHGYTVPVGAGRTTPGSNYLKATAPAFAIGDIGSFSRFLQKTFGVRVRLWITEFGWQTNPPDRRSGISYAAQARLLRRAIAMIRSSGRVERAYWFLLRDEPLVYSDGSSATWQSGLRTAAGTRKPGFKVWASLFPPSP
jgi:Glycosyl hydrolase catalytic core